ncbi:MAG: GtrA family protein [Actinomycetota bacterium]|nr:GtrA family protein [Actinomycetota bacterium]
MLNRLWDLRVKLLRFAGVSVVALVVTQTTLFVCKGILDWPGVTSNVVAVCLAAIPAYLLNRRWVWGKNGRHSIRGEIVPFWTYNLVGLVFSTFLVALADRWWGTTWSVLAANLIAFGVLWIGKFLFLEKVLFGTPEVAAPEAV